MECKRLNLLKTLDSLEFFYAAWIFPSQACMNTGEQIAGPILRETGTMQKKTSDITSRKIRRLSRNVPFLILILLKENIFYYASTSLQKTMNVKNSGLSSDIFSALNCCTKTSKLLWIKINNWLSFLSIDLKQNVQVCEENWSKIFYNKK